MLFPRVTSNFAHIGFEEHRNTQQFIFVMTVPVYHGLGEKGAGAKLNKHRFGLSTGEFKALWRRLDPNLHRARIADVQPII